MNFKIFDPLLFGAAILMTLLVAAAKPACAQDTFTYKAETHLIDTAVSVHTRDGASAENLTAQDFTVTEDGVPQTIRFFAHDRTLPLSIGLLIDVSGSQEKFVKAHERDIEAFLRAALGPEDEAFAVCFGNHLRLVSEYTASVPALVEGLHAFDKGGRKFPEIGPSEDRALGTALYDAIYFGIEAKLHERPQRRKVLLVMSDGEENSSEHDLLDAIAAAQDADVVLYALRYTEAAPDKLSARDRYGMRVLDHLAEQTGGKAYDVRAIDPAQAFAEIAGELRSTYEIAYQSTNPVRDGRFRKVTILAVRPDLVVRSRPGYVAR